MVERASLVPGTDPDDAELSRRKRIATELAIGDVGGVEATDQFLKRWGSLE